MFFVNVRLKCIFLALEESTIVRRLHRCSGSSLLPRAEAERPAIQGRLMQNWHINLANFFTSTNGIRERDWWPYFRRTQVICSVTYTAASSCCRRYPTAAAGLPNCHLLACRLIRHRGQPLILLRVILIYQCKKIPLPLACLLIWKLSSVVFHTFSFNLCIKKTCRFCFLPSCSSYQSYRSQVLY